MHKQKIILYTMKNGNLHTIIKTKHSRIIYWELTRKNDQFIVKDCYYLDRIQSGKYYAVPRKQKTKVFHKNQLLEVVSSQLDRTYYGVEIASTLSELTTEEFISFKLNEFKRGYNFLIFVGEGFSVNGLPQILTTRLANRLHRKIYLRINYYKNGFGTVEAYYYDRCYKSRSRVIPQMLTTVFVEYKQGAIIELINRELNCDFTDMIITDKSIDVENNESALCGCI